jgi:hypothetical protein
MVVVYSNPLTGEYKFELSQGKYSLTYESDKAEKVVTTLDLPLNAPSDSIVLPGTTLPKTDFTADLVVESNKTISVVTGDTVSIPLKVEPNSMLTVEHWLGDSLLSSEKFLIKDTAFIYKTMPLFGDNRLVFKLTDKYGNATTSEILISRTKVVTEQPVVSPVYKRVIAEKQIAAFLDLLKNRADDDLKAVIIHSDVGKQEFGKLDDILQYIKKEAAKSNISPIRVDKLALKVAVMDNVLTQAAVDLIASNTEGELKNILDSLNIYDKGLKTWTDLQNYISEKSKGRILPADLNRIVADILADLDPRIAIIRNKVLIYSGAYKKGATIKEAVTNVDKTGVNKSGLWIKNLYDESLKLKMTDREMAKMFSILSALPGTEPQKYLDDLAGFSEGPFKDYLNSLDLKGIRVKNCEELLLYLLRNKDKGLYSESDLFNTLGRIIASKDIPTDIITSQLRATEKPKLFIIWLILGAGLIFFIIFFWRRRKKDKKNRDE